MKKIKEILQNQPKFLSLLIIFWVYGLLGSLVLSFFYLHNWHESVYKLSFDFGDLLENMVKRGEYRSSTQSYYHTENPHLTFSAHRLPFIPYFLYSLVKLTGIETVGKIALIKNFIFMIITAASFYYATVEKPLATKYKWIALIFLFTFPQLFVHSLEIDMEESYFIPLAALFWALISYSGKPTPTFNALFVFSAVMLFFAKNTFLYICPLLPILYYILYKNKKIVAITYVLLIFSGIGLATLNYHNAGKFSVNYTFEGWNLYKGNCEKTMEVYPKYTVDVLDEVDPIIVPAKDAANEWTFDKYYKKLAMDYIKTHKWQTFTRLFPKFFTIFIDIRPNGINYGEERYDSPWRYLGSFYMLILRILEWSCIFTALYCVWKKRQNCRLFIYSIAFLCFIGFLCGPYVLAFGYERHLAPIFFPVVFTALYFLNERLTKNGGLNSN